ncbi:MAG: hypothetical protein DMF57_11310 [Acidobacteria bacterium]|nr:MAG: hypothetical protein DMF57_11310 [Acidobacteriota bacterium]
MRRSRCEACGPISHRALSGCRAAGLRAPRSRRDHRLDAADARHIGYVLGRESCRAGAHQGSLRLANSIEWSDFPVEAVNPFFGIYAAVTRQDQKGWPAGGWYPDQKLTLAEAIRGFTSDAAYAAFEETSRGTIEPGKLADFTILEGNVYTMPQSELFKAKVRYTVVGGEIVFTALPAR